MSIKEKPSIIDPAHIEDAKPAYNQSELDTLFPNDVQLSPEEQKIFHRYAVIIGYVCTFNGRELSDVIGEISQRDPEFRKVSDRINSVSPNPVE